MTLYFIIMLTFSGCGVLVLVGLITRESVLNRKSERVFNVLVGVNELRDDASMSRDAIAAARKSMANVEAAQAKVTAQIYERPGPSTPSAEQKAANEKLDEYASVIGLLVKTFAESAGNLEFPTRAFARHNWNERAPISNLMLLLLADKEISKARRL